MVKRKHRLRTDTLREIRATFGRFLSILLLCLLATSFFSGLRTAAPDMRHTADAYFDDMRLGDLRVLSTLGVTEDDVAALAALDGVEYVEGNWAIDALARSSDADLIVKLHAVSDDINRLYLVEGRMPEAANECVTETSLLAGLGLEIGDSFVVEPNTDDALAYTELTIVGRAHSASYVSLQRGSASIGSGEVKAFVYLPREAFTLDYFTEAHLTLSGAREMQSYSDEYSDFVDDFIDRNEAFADERAAMRTAEIRGEAEDKYNDAKAEADEKLGDAERELADARKELDDGYKELADAKAELETSVADARAEIEDNRRKLDDALKEIEQGEKDLKDGGDELDRRDSEFLTAKAKTKDGRAQYDAGVAEYEAGCAQYSEGAVALEQAKGQLAMLEASGATDPVTLGTIAAIRNEVAAREPELTAAKQQLDAVKAMLDETKQQLDDADAQLAEAEAELSKARGELDEALQKLADGRREYDDGVAALEDAEKELADKTADAQAEIDDAERKLADGEIEYQDGLAEYLDAKAEADDKLADARKEIDDIDDATWYVLSRSTNLGYAAFEQDSDRVSNLANIFPIIFFVVAALVCLTTMTRMVEEQRTQIGSLGSLGYSPAVIASKYVGYGLLASLLGSILGVIAGETVIPIIIFTAWKIMYYVPYDLMIPMDWSISLASIAAAVFCTVGASLWASFSTLASTPANLMRPRAPKPGKRVLLERITPLWSRMKFISKVTGRNLFRYKKRFFMTIIGIAGCTALMVTGFGLHDSIFDILSLQFDEIDKYQGTIGLEDDLSDERLNEIFLQLDEVDALEDYLPVRQLTITVESPKRSMNSYLSVVDPARLDDFVVIRHRSDHEHVDLPDDGVLINEKLSELMGIGKGDVITLDDDGRVDAVIADVIENYALHYVYISPDYYRELFGREPQVTASLAKYAAHDAAEDDLARALIAIDGVTGADRISTVRDRFDDSLKSINYAVIIIIVSAAALAFVVLYNLTNINITERIRELATLKVLGFYDGEVSAYIYRENLLLTIFGTIAGLFAGYFLHHWLVMTVEVELVMFGRDANAMSYIWAVILTVVFSVLVNFAAHIKIKRIDMVESLKSIE